jgi:hypothetical protein
VGVSGEYQPEFIQPVVHAPLDHHACGHCTPHICDIGVESLPLSGDRVSPVDRLDDLLGAKRDQHADDDDPHLADKLAPAVQRLGEVEMHQALR